MWTPQPLVALHVDADMFVSNFVTIPAYPTIDFVASVKMVANPVAGRFNEFVKGWIFTRYATVCAQTWVTGVTEMRVQRATMLRNMMVLRVCMYVCECYYGIYTPNIPYFFFVAVDIVCVYMEFTDMYIYVY